MVDIGVWVPEMLGGKLAVLIYGKREGADDSRATSAGVIFALSPAPIRIQPTHNQPKSLHSDRRSYPFGPRRQFGAKKRGLDARELRSE
jgi:hypothetical protein